VFALAGGVLMAWLAVMTVISVFGRWLFSAPIYGDFEMVAMGTAVSVFLFLPYCQMRKGNVVVDVFLNWAPNRVQRFFDLIGQLVLATIAGALAWRMWLGAEDMLKYNEISMILGIPVWIAFPFGVAGFAMLAVCCLYDAGKSAREVLK
jgi:TRAP-type C4-dicarboxylate transport system permease small subunit